MSLVPHRQSRQPDVQSLLRLQRGRQSAHLLDEGGEVHRGSGRGAGPGERHQVRTKKTVYSEPVDCTAELYN